jgi:hypothetical protein
MSSNSIYPLPLQLVGFTGNRVGANDLLSWKSVDEINFSHFDVEYSATGLAFNKIGEVAAQGMPGSGVNQTYNFTHSDVSGVAYYRLKIVDANGNFVYSNIVKTSGGNTGCFTIARIYPVPFINELHISIFSCKQKKAIIAMYNASGSKLLEETQTIAAGSGIYNLHNLSRLATGTYFVWVKTNEERIILKAVK